MTAPISADVLKSKHHFEILDGLRGVAAISVVVFHFMEFVVPDYEKSFIAHSYQAVDFFFCLSGFVIAYAYDTRLKEMGFANFLKLRLIRLHPLVIIGAIIGVLCFVFDGWSGLFVKYGVKETVWMFVTSCLMIPYALVEERYYTNFHLNPPTWSLFWEYIANIIYGLMLIRISNKVLWAILVIATGLLINEARTAHSISNGWAGSNFWGGGVRVLYSFTVGLLIYRSNFIIKNKLGFIGVGILLILAFIFPWRKNWAGVSDVLSIMFYLPLMVALGAGAHLKEQLKKACKFLGDISYPLYMVHYPLLWLYYSYLLKYKPSMQAMAISIPIGTILLIGFAYGVMKLFDEPVRKALRRKLSKNLN